MDAEFYKRLLLAKEQELSAEIGAESRSAGSTVNDSAHDTADDSIEDDIKSNLFIQANTLSELLNQVRDALGRIERGTFGRCVVDGGPIEEKRLKAIPWTPYCLKHEREREGADPEATPTL